MGAWIHSMGEVRSQDAEGRTTPEARCRRGIRAWGRAVKYVRSFGQPAALTAFSIPPDYRNAPDCAQLWRWLQCSVERWFSKTTHRAVPMIVFAPAMTFEYCSTFSPLLSRPSCIRDRLTTDSRPLLSSESHDMVERQHQLM